MRLSKTSDISVRQECVRMAGVVMQTVQHQMKPDARQEAVMKCAKAFYEWITEGKDNDDDTPF
jgi:hypothetical protein